MRKRGMSDNIPFEMQVEIMKKLPVKSLAVFRSVSKAWKSMIDSPLFIKNYNLCPHHHLFIMCDVDTSPYEAEFKNVDNDEFDNVCNVRVPFQRLESLKLVGTSNGLLCVSGYSYEDGCKKNKSVIWNPSLRKSIAVDVPYLYAVLGFGVHLDSFDPVIVMINNPVSVFTLSSPGWRVPRGNLPPKSITFEYWSPVPTDDQRIYWKAFKGSIHLVVAFDMVSEDFMEINLPHSVAHRSSVDFSISKIKESLALLEYYSDSEKPVCDVWMMVEDGVSKSFTKLFTINTPDAPLRRKVLGFSKNDQPIMETPTDKFMISTLEAYEPSTRVIKNLEINGVLNSFFCCAYTETLLLLDQLDGSTL